MTAVFKIVNAAVFQELADNASDADVLGHPGHARAKSTDPTDDQVDLHPGTRRFIKCVDDPCIGKAIDLRRDAGWNTLLRVFGFAFYQLDHSLAEDDRSDKQFLKFLLISVHGQIVEKFCCVFTDLLIRGQKPEVRIDSRGRRVVVTGGEMNVTPEPVAFAADDQRRLRMGLEAEQTIYDVNTGTLEPLTPL